MKQEEVIALFHESDLITASYEQDSLSGDLQIDFETQVQEIYKKSVKVKPPLLMGQVNTYMDCYLINVNMT
nr:hypothetical protein [Spiroplasma clarkii]